MRKLRSRLTYANVMATLAFLIAVAGGTAYAANTIGSADIINGQVRSVDIGSNQVQSVDVRDDTLADGGLTGDDIANSSLNHLDVGFNGLTGQEINESLTESEIADGGLNDEDIAEGAFVSFSGSIGNVPAHDCVEKQVSGVNAEGDHLLLTPEFNTQADVLTYSAEYDDLAERMWIQACNPTGSSVSDGTTNFNLLVINAR